MFKRQKKTWTEVARRFTPPCPVKVEIDRCTEQMFRRISEGVTVIELRCNETGELKFYEEYGDQR